MRHIQPERFGKVAVVMGGWSAERDVSLMSGQQVFDSLTSAGIKAHAVDAGRDIARVLSEGGFDRAFLILHGRGGEDGVVQAALELAGIPYTGSGVLASALCMDKWRAKGLVSLSGVSTPQAFEVLTMEEAGQAATAIGYPIVVKPTLEGSSIGVTMVNHSQQLASAFSDARRYGPVLVEQRMTGIEVTAGIIGQTVLPLVSMKGADEFYDYKAKYLADDTVYNCPVELPPEVIATIEDMAMRAFRALDCRGWGRVDFMLDASGAPQFIECNTAPGMTSHSLVPIAARAAGLDFETLCLQILADTLPVEKLAA
ncbi:MAG: D-alanine--D-alanine ligase [Granulosicoccus sp.]|nr:D-alanine--D-alanine ligase [Granulosicoccus sp.]